MDVTLVMIYEKEDIMYYIIPIQNLINFIIYQYLL